MQPQIEFSNLSSTENFSQNSIEFGSCQPCTDITSFNSYNDIVWENNSTLDFSKIASLSHRVNSSPLHQFAIVNHNKNEYHNNARRMLSFDGKLCGVETEVIIDSGCDVVSGVISSDVVNHHGLPSVKITPFKVQVANGQFVQCSQKLSNISLKLGNFKESLDLYILPLKGLQVVLGSDWLARRNPNIDWSSGTMTIVRGTKGDATKTFSTVIRPKHNAANLNRTTVQSGCQVVEQTAAQFSRTLKNLNKSFRSRHNKHLPTKEYFRKMSTMQAVDQTCFISIIRKKKDIIMTDDFNNPSCNIVIPSVTADEVEAADSQFDKNNSFSDPSREKSSKPRRACTSEMDKQIFQDYTTPEKNVFPVDLPKGLPLERSFDTPHFIPLMENAVPYSRSPYKCSNAELEELRKQLEYYVDQGWIRPSHSPWGSPILFVPKKNGKLRFCVDYRQLNNRTIKSKYPLPNIDNMMETLQGSEYFSKIDLSQGYHQMRVHDEDIPKTAMNTRYGQFEWLVMNFGLSNAPATFMHAMNSMFHDLLDVSVIIFLDDILIFSKNKQDHEKHVREVLDRLHANHWYANWEKSEFDVKEVEYCGLMVSKEGLSVVQDKIKSITDWPLPQSVRDIRSFLGLAGYYRRFVSQFSALAKPLTSLTKKSVSSFQLTPEAISSFQTLKERLVSAPVLILPNPSLPYVVVPDASGYAVGGIIMQEKNDGSGLHPVAYCSRQMINAELRYPVHQQELLAIFYLMKQYRHLLIGQQVTVHTDHAPLKHLQTQPSLAPRIARWLEFLADFNLDIIAIPGTSNPADAVSRRPDYLQNFLRDQETIISRQQDNSFAEKNISSLIFTDGKFSEFSQRSLCACNAVNKITLANVIEDADSLWGNDPQKYFFLVESETSDNDHLPFDTNIIIPDPDFLTSLRRGYETDPVAVLLFDSTAARNHLMQQNYTIIDKLIYRNVDGNMILYIPATSTIHKDETTEYKLREELLRQCHDVPTYGHQGRDRTLELLSRNFYWPGMYRDVAEYVYTCKSCQRAKPRRHRPYGNTVNIETPTDNWADICMDLIIDLPRTKSGYNAIFVVMDLLSKRAHFLRCKNTINALQLATLFFHEIYRLHGIPVKIVSDRDSKFTSKFWIQLFKILDTRLAMSTPFHPNTDPAERVNQSLEIMLRMYANDNSNDWDDYLPAVEFAYNNSQNSSTKYTPFFLDNGRHPITPASLLSRAQARTGRMKSTDQFITAWSKYINQARDNLDAQKSISKFYRDKKMLPKVFAPGELVWISSKHVHYPGKLKKPKFSDLYLGPVEVISATSSDMAYKLKLPSHIKCHDVQPISRLEPFRFSENFEHPERPPDSATIYFDGTKEYTVEAVVDKRFVRYGRGGRTEYLIKYQGEPSFENQWKPERELTHCRHAIDIYEAEHPSVSK